MLRLGGHLVAAGHLADGDAVFGLIEFRDKLFEQRADALGRLVQRGGQLGQGQRLFGHVDDGFQDGAKLGVLHRDGRGRFFGEQLFHGDGRFAGRRLQIRGWGFAGGRGLFGWLGGFSRRIAGGSGHARAVVAGRLRDDRFVRIRGRSFSRRIGRPLARLFGGRHVRTLLRDRGCFQFFHAQM